LGPKLIIGILFAEIAESNFYNSFGLFGEASTSTFSSLDLFKVYGVLIPLEFSSLFKFRLVPLYCVLVMQISFRFPSSKSLFAVTLAAIIVYLFLI